MNYTGRGTPPCWLRTAVSAEATLHSHVYLHRGHLYTEIAMARRLGEVNRLWDAF